jgi:hypothetical protein
MTAAILAKTAPLAAAGLQRDRRADRPIDPAARLMADSLSSASDDDVNSAVMVHPDQMHFRQYIAQ